MRLIMFSVATERSANSANISFKNDMKYLD